MAQQESQAFKQLKEQLREMFQLDRGDLDFGLYRIMNQKRGEVTEFLDKHLLPQVQTVLQEYQPAGGAGAQAELDKLLASLSDAGVDPETSPKVQELRAKLSDSVDMGKLENEIYSDLYNFFKRYYSEGDFMSMRRYKEGVYALPYEGEEVKLHWANHDQYYIKTSENLKNYSFKTAGGKRVRFEVVAGGTEVANNKAAEGKERRFVLHEAAPTVATADELTIRFEYRPDDGKRKQDDITKETLEQLLNLAEVNSFGLSEKAPTEKNKDRTLLEKHVSDYSAKHSFDYFIHKDLGRFLRQELDFYIKNEIMHLDDIENETAPKVETYLAKVKAMRKVAGKIIQFLAQLEDFQKKLWLKKKFVLETHYCITLDHIIGSEAEDELLPIIAANEAQREEWVKLFAIDDLDGYITPLTPAFLKANDKLLVDTKFFDVAFKYRLLGLFDDLDEQTDGVMINSENFQALNLLQERYKEKVKCIYIDPPYNAKTSEILYKNTFKHSSFLSFVYDRLKISRSIMKDDSIFVMAIDENETDRLAICLDDIFQGYDRTCVSVVHNPRGIQGSAFSYTNEFSHFVFPKGLSLPKRQMEDTKEKPLMKTGSESERTSGRNCFYPVIIDKQGNVMGLGDVPEDNHHPESSQIEKSNGTLELWPLCSENKERKWRYKAESLQKVIEDVSVRKTRDGKWVVYLGKNHETYRTVWSDAMYNAAEYGSTLLKNMIKDRPFSFPKSLYTVKDCCYIGLNAKNDELTLDFFAGSGTTGHAIIDMNRKDGGKRKYALVEMGEYFASVTHPRILKAAYSKDWKDGKPISREGVSHVLKYMALEQYEDALDNLGLNKSETQAALLASNPTLNEQYMLGYMLDVESRGSQSLLNIDDFADPFAYTLRITRNDDTQLVNVDLVETFNYLLGLTIRTVDRDKTGIVTVTGKNALGENCLIIWRNTQEVDNNKLDAWFGKRYSSKDFEFDAIYVNGDNNIENMKLADTNFEDGHWKVRLIEAEFKRLMFDVQDV
ncbi:DNA methyltransferase [Alphaproteobacteria bacterium]|nr:DNA methyltransferase [Alphaproteobacteria bacterium]